MAQYWHPGRNDHLQSSRIICIASEYVMAKNLKVRFSFSAEILFRNLPEEMGAMSNVDLRSSRSCFGQPEQSRVSDDRATSLYHLHWMIT